MNKKYQVFISSTYNDLKAERQKVCDAVLALYQIPIGMEMFSAADEEQWEIIKSHIDDTDYYVLIIGNRYGSVIQDGHDKGISYTEKEYNYAVSQGVPVLAYLIDEDVPVKPSYVEKENNDKLKAFKERVSNGREVVWWKTPDELATKVSQSLFKQIFKGKRPGWIRANNSSGTKMLTVDSDIINTKIVEPEKDKDNDILLNKDLLTKGKGDCEKKITEIYRIYVEQVKPMILLIEVDTAQYPMEVMNEIHNVFNHIATYSIYGDEKDLDKAHDHMIVALVDAMKYTCVTNEDYYQTFLNNRKIDKWSKMAVADEIIKQGNKAKKCYAKARWNEGFDIHRSLQFYEDAFNQYQQLRSMIDEYVDSL